MLISQPEKREKLEKKTGWSLALYIIIIIHMKIFKLFYPESVRTDSLFPGWSIRRQLHVYSSNTSFTACESYSINY